MPRITGGSVLCGHCLQMHSFDITSPGWAVKIVTPSPVSIILLTQHGTPLYSSSIQKITRITTTDSANLPTPPRTESE